MGRNCLIFLLALTKRSTVLANALRPTECISTEPKLRKLQLWYHLPSDVCLTQKELPIPLRTLSEFRSQRQGIWLLFSRQLLPVRPHLAILVYSSRHNALLLKSVRAHLQTNRRPTFLDMSGIKSLPKLISKSCFCLLYSKQIVLLLVIPPEYIFTFQTGSLP